MPVEAKKRGDKWRVVEVETDKIAMNDAGTAVDGGGHDTKEAAEKQAAAINARHGGNRMQLKRIQRDARFDGDGVDQETRTAWLSFSSEFPYRDYPWEDTPQILLHTKDAVQFDRMRDLGAVLFNHHPDHIIGRVERLSVDEKAHKGRGLIRFDETEPGELAFQRVLSGSLRGVSVGANPIKRQIVRDGETWKSPDGREWEGPLSVIHKWEVIELSLTPIPSDAGVGIGRSGAATEEQTIMKIPAEVRELLISRGLPEGSTDEQALEFMRGLEIPIPKEEESEEKPVERKMKEEEKLDPVRVISDERKRIDDLTKIQQKSGLPEYQLERWIQEGTSTARAREVAVEFMAERFRPINTSGSRVEVILEARDKHNRAMEAAIFRRASGFVNARKWEYDEKACVDVPVDLPMVEIARQMLVHAGLREAQGWGRMEVITRGLQHSTSDFSNLLGNVANKSLGVGYDEARTTWQAWCATGTLTDFKSASRVAVGDTTDFEVVQELMPITETTMSEKAETRQLSTYAKRFGVSRQALVNDDLSEFTRTPQKLGAAAARTINSLVYQQLTSPPTMAEDSTTLFATTHTSGSNKATTAGDPSVAGLEAASILMRKQLGVGYRAYLNLRPKFLIGPVALEVPFLQIVRGGGDNVGFYPSSLANVVLDWMSNLIPVVDPQLDGSSASTWYIAADPNDIDTIRVEFLNGMQSPNITRLEGTAILGVEWVAYIDFSVKVFDHRGLVQTVVS